MGMGFQFEQHRLGLWGLELGFEKNNLLGNGMRTPPSQPSMMGHLNKIFPKIQMPGGGGGEGVEVSL